MFAQEKKKSVWWGKTNFLANKNGSRDSCL